MMEVRPQDVTAILVTRGNVPMEPILETLPYKDILIWDNSDAIYDHKVFGRYRATKFTTKDFIYFQDDDVIFRDHESLLFNFNLTPYMMVANDAHGDNPAGYEDVGLVGAGALVPVVQIANVWLRWFQIHEYNPRKISLPPWDKFLYEADFVFGTLCPHRTVKLPYERLYADDMTRLCNQPWQEEAKRFFTEEARRIRDGA